MKIRLNDNFNSYLLKSNQNARLEILNSLEKVLINIPKQREKEEETQLLEKIYEDLNKCDIGIKEFFQSMEPYLKSDQPYIKLLGHYNERKISTLKHLKIKELDK